LSIDIKVVLGALSTGAQSTSTQHYRIESVEQNQQRQQQSRLDDYGWSTLQQRWPL
jgi:hypothetical protein